MTKPTALYRLFGTDGALLYVGISIDPPTRFKAHSQRDWWHDVTTTTIEWHDNEVDALLAEKRAIENERPVHNRALTVPHGDHGQRCARIAELRDQLDEAEARASALRAQLTAEVAAACKGAGRGVATEVATYARWSPGHVRLIRDRGAA